jgi:hypothetical protein
MSLDARAAVPPRTAAENTPPPGNPFADTVPRQLRRRAQAARGCDPWTVDQAEWQDSWDLRMARLGWAPHWQRERARELWQAGAR